MPKRKRTVLVTPSPKPPAVRDRCFCEDSASVVLSDLPEEILKKIFEMLDPQSVIAISKLNIHRLDNLLCDLKFADFSTCNAITSEDLTSYFQKGREKHLKEIVLRCPNAEFVFNFSPSYETSLPAQSAFGNISMQLRRRQNPTISFNILGLSSAEECSVGLLRFAAWNGLEFRHLYNRRFPEWAMQAFLTYHSPFLQVFDDDKHLSEIPELPCESVESLVLFMNEKPDSLDHLDKIKKATGKALKNLSLYRSKYPSIPQQQGMHPLPLIQDRGNMPLEPDIASHYIQDVLNQLVA
ncbi:hypothetical protein JTE90_012565, partial [Oedothorax gibbosus]